MSLKHVEPCAKLQKKLDNPKAARKDAQSAKSATAHFGVFDDFAAASRCHASMRRMQAGPATSEYSAGTAKVSKAVQCVRKGICPAASHGR
ncbi:hypothetical protein [Vandammella animalimorsus]|uniref:hypothetical protein n=1 Tax=Vandammella animalimorsus TaxID=2029117 RepID=UPI00117875A4|nr:hypothetical protein [Vandammella animalimorsus]